MTRWPWSRGNRHAWELRPTGEPPVVLELMSGVRITSKPAEWWCRCGATFPAADGGNTPTGRPRYGCTALPVPVRAPERGSESWPIPSCAHVWWWDEQHVGHCRTCGETR
ncbi:MAG: hypothetical protein ACO1SX_22245 [Actinomycetota bacterium]